MSMPIDSKLDALIEQEMTGLTEQGMLRSGMSYNDFSGEFSDIVGQAKEDKRPLVAAGFNWDLMVKYLAYLSKLSIEHGKRVASEGMEAEVEAQFKALMPQAKAAKKIIMVVIRFILARTKDDNIRRANKMIRKGYQAK